MDKFEEFVYGEAQLILPAIAVGIVAGNIRVGAGAYLLFIVFRFIAWIA